MEQILEISYSLENITDAVVEFWKALNEYKTFAFNGEMGAGKTTFIHALCGHLGVTDAVSSPTFALINEYHFTDVSGKDSIIYHMDWYRLKNTEEAINAGMEDCLLQPGVYCFVEWPSIAQELLPFPYLLIDINIVSPTERILYATVKTHKN